MNLTGSIESAENKFKQILEEFFISVWGEKSIASHGIDHHRRVWSYSKEFLQFIHPENTLQSSQLSSKLIIASYLHDTGMTVDSGEKHGKLSRNFCVQFFADNNIDQEEFSDVLEAIENHDNKNYSGNNSTNDLLAILSVADDLDAFGFTGIYRYAEIYLTRGIVPEKIGYLIAENAEKRFKNFIRTFGFAGEIVNKHKKRYEVLNNFFIRYNEQLPSYHFGIKNPYGYCGVVEIIHLMLKDGITLNDFFKNSENYSYDPLIVWFFVELEKELSVTLAS
jgi:hypothetical protein